MATVTVYVPTDMLLFPILTGSIFSVTSTEIHIGAGLSAFYLYGSTTGTFNDSFISYALIDNNDLGLLPNFSISFETPVAVNLFANSLLTLAAVLTAGDDRIIGSSGIDVLSGAAGNDTYVLSAGDTIFDTLGNDTVESSLISLDLANYPGIENIKLTGGLTLSATGNADANILDGSANTAFNTLTGLAGDDTYVLGRGDILIEAAGGGTDTVQSAVRSLDLASFANVENVSLLGASGLFAKGNARANVLSGHLNTAANVLTGLGGNDTYVVGSKDKVIESTSGGSDTVSSSTISLNLASYANVENAALLGSAKLKATGNGAGNTIAGEGNTAANVLTGLGGNDTYDVGTGDAIVEAVGGGTDTVRSSTIDVFLSRYANVEKVVLRGNANIFAIGDNKANVLNGELNTGANNLEAGFGNDTYFVGVGDTVDDFAGIDLVRSSTTNINLSLGPINGIENVTLGGSLGLSVVGNGAANIIIGNSGSNNMGGEGGNDVLNGGRGADTLAGGAGRDTFVFNSARSVTNIDLITDFSAADDTIQLENAVFTAFKGLAAGTRLSSSAFLSGTNIIAAQTASQHIIYNQSSGALYYDADGRGGASAVQFATLGLFSHPTNITAADFVII